jgi:tetratricopeptide (TPR) repeat protein
LGVGFLIGARHVVTCSHVVNKVLQSEGGSADLCRVDFPCLKKDAFGMARVVLRTSEQLEDIAVLELIDPPPEGARGVRPLLARDPRQLWRHEFTAFGVPQGVPGGGWASGVMCSDQADGWVQIEGVHESGYAVVPGYSGSPVWDLQFNGVVGMVLAADSHILAKVAFMVPVAKLIEAWPDLAAWSLDVESKEYLEAQLGDLLEEQKGAGDPSRFEEAIDALRAAIANWHGRTQRQRQRIREGLEVEVERRVAFAGGRLPDAGEHFKDRVHEQDRIGALLSEDATRLVSVIGRGGMGKTALVSRVLKELERHRWPHSDQGPVEGIVCLSARSAVINLERLFLACAEMLDGECGKALLSAWTAPQVPLAQKVTALLEALRRGRYVIVLDNLEDLLDAQGSIVDRDLNLFFEQTMLTGGACLLVTSRVALSFRREVMQYDQQVPLVDGLPEAEGVALLRECDPNGRYGLLNADEAELVKAVRVVHGVPRALEVIASILAHDPYAKLADVTRNFFSMEEVVDSLIRENYKRLDAGERRVIEALAVFRRPVQEVAVDYLLEPFEPGLDVPGIVQRLARTNVVTVDRHDRTIALHPIDQDYSYSQLREAGADEPGYTREALERRAARFYAKLRTPAATWSSVRDLEPQLCEFEHLVRAGDYHQACHLLAGIDYDFLYKWGHYSRLIEMHAQLSGHLADLGDQAYSWGSQGLARFQLGQVDQAISAYDQGLAAARAGHDRWNESICLARLGNAHSFLGRVDRAIEDFQAALQIARETGDRRGEEWQLSALGNAHRKLGEIDRSIEFYQQALAIAKEIDDRRGQRFASNGLGNAYLDQGQPELAIPVFEEALAMARADQGRRTEGLCLLSLSRAYRGLWQIERAIELGERALSIARELQHPSDESHALVDLAWAALCAKQPERARVYCAAAVKLDVPTSHPPSLVEGLALLHLKDPGAGAAFARAVGGCRAMLQQTPNLREARYALAAALLGTAVCDPQWTAAAERAALLAPALAEYRTALAACAAGGLVGHARRVVDELCQAGVEDIEPVRALLGLHGAG